MPLYDATCRACGKTFEHFAKMDDREVPCECGGTAARILTARYYAHSDLDFVTDNITGEPERIDSRVKLRRLLKENGVSEKVGQGWW